MLVHLVRRRSNVESRTPFVGTPESVKTCSISFCLSSDALTTVFNGDCGSCSVSRVSLSATITVLFSAAQILLCVVKKRTTEDHPTFLMGWQRDLLRSFLRYGHYTYVALPSVQGMLETLSAVGCFDLMTHVVQRWYCWVLSRRVIYDLVSKLNLRVAVPVIALETNVIPR